MRVFYRLWILLEHHAWAAVAAWIVVSGTVLVTDMRWPKRYTASALIKLVSSEQSSARLNPSALKQDVLTDSELLEIGQKFRLLSIPDESSAIKERADTLRRDISVEQENDANAGQNILRLAYSGWNKTTALGVTNALAESFALYKRAKPTQAPVDALQIQPAKEQATVASTAVTSERETQLRHKLAAILQNVMDQEAELQASIQKLITLEHERQNAAVARSAAAANARAQEQAKKTNTEALLRQQLGDATKHLADLRQRYTEEYPDVVSAKEKVQEAQERLARQQSASVPLVPEKQAPSLPSAAEFELQEEQIRAQQTELEQAINTNRAEATRLQQLLSARSPEELKPQSANAVPLAPNAKKDAKTSEISWTPSFVIQRDASIEKESTIISRQTLWLLSMLPGLFAATLTIIIREHLDKSIKSEAALRNELPHSATYIGAIPRIRHEIIAE